MKIQISRYLIRQGRYDEAKLRLQNVLFNTAFEFCALTAYLGDCFRHEKQQPDLFAA